MSVRCSPRLRVSRLKYQELFEAITNIVSSFEGLSKKDVSPHGLRDYLSPLEVGNKKTSGECMADFT